MTEMIPVLLRQFLHQLPTLLVFLVGGIAAALYLNRLRAPALLCLIGCAVSLLTILVLTGLQGWMLGARMRDGWSMARYGQAMTLLGMAGAVLRSIGLGLILAAVFAGRTAPAPSPED